MTSNKNIKETTNLSLEPLGVKARTFAADYHDDKNNCFNMEYSSIALCSDNQIAESIIYELESKGFTVYCVYEVLGDYTLHEIEKIILRNPQSGSEYVKLLYYDKQKELA